MNKEKSQRNSKENLKRSKQKKNSHDNSIRTSAGSLAAVCAIVRLLYCIIREGAMHALIEIRVLPQPLPLIYKAIDVIKVRIFSITKTKAQRAENLQRAIARLGGSYAKLGQALSVRPELVGEENATALAQLQDRMPPLPSKVIRREIEKAFGKKISEIYKSFDNNAAAAASIAQVHRAQTHHGTEVAVKVLRPRIREQFQKEIALTRLAIKFVEWKNPNLKNLRFQTILDTYATWVEGEIDLRREAASASQLEENMRGEKGFRIPKIEWQLTNKHVLTIEWIDGVRIDDEKALKKFGIESEELLDRSAQIFFKQTFRDGFFHADIHPGNLFIEENGTMVPVDFGIMGRLDLKTRHHLADILLGFINQDYARVARAYIDAGYTAKKVDLESLTLACRSVGEPLFGSKDLNDISFAEVLLGVIRIGDRFELNTQTKLLLLHKAMLQGEGVGQLLNAKVNIWMRTQPLIEQWLIDNRNPRTIAIAFIRQLASGWNSRLKQQHNATTNDYSDAGDEHEQYEHQYDYQYDYSGQDSPAARRILALVDRIVERVFLAFERANNAHSRRKNRHKE